MSRVALALTALVLMPLGCVERTVSIESVPSGATVWVNDREVGVTPCEFSFTHYGTFDVRVALDGYEPLVLGAEATAPWWDTMPLDLVAEVLPGRFVSRNAWRFELVPGEVAPEELLRRAGELRGRTALRGPEVPAPASR